MKNLICSLSGIRGITGDGLSPAVARKTGELFFKSYLLKKIKKGSALKVVAGKDPKASGMPLISGLLEGLGEAAAQKGIPLKVIYLGVTSTPAVEWAVSKYSAAGGVMITASHNPVQWNGIKLISGGGNIHPTLLPPDDIAVINKLLGACPAPGRDETTEFLPGFVPAVKIPAVTKYVDAYCGDVLEKTALIIDECSGIRGTGKGIISKIGKSSFKIVLDACSGDGARLPLSVLKSLGIGGKNVVVINSGRIEELERPLEPSVENLDNLRDAIKKHGADAGFAVDPDQDRLVAMPLSSEENTPLVAAKFLLELQKKSGKKIIKRIVVNTSTSRAWEDLAAEYGVGIIRVPVGEVNVALEMIKRGIIFGAEGNGGVILGPVNYGRNSAAGMALIMSYLAWSGKTLDAINRELPQFYMTKQKVLVEGIDPAGIIKKVINRYGSEKSVEKIETYDGVKISFKNGSWLQVRTSNTEPIIRIFAEVRAAESQAASEKRTGSIINRVKKTITSGAE